MTLALWRQTFRLRCFGWLKIPLLGAVRPSVVELDDRRCVVRVPLRRRTRNHLGSMYFGALAIGADCAGGLLAAEFIRRGGIPVGFIFKSFNARFLRRPEADVYFICEEGGRIRELVDQAVATGERATGMIELRAAVRAPGGGWEPVAEFTLELSLKRT